jgi:hypothetical protein
MLDLSSSYPGLTDAQEAAPKISQASGIVVFISFGVFIVGAVWQTTWLLRHWIHTGTPPSGFTPGMACLFAFGPVIFLAWLGTGLFRGFGTRLSEQGISIPTLRGRVLVRWSEIERGQIRGQALRLSSATHHVLINPFFYAEPARVPPFVLRHLPAHLSLARELDR